METAKLSEHTSEYNAAELSELTSEYSTTLI